MYWDPDEKTIYLLHSSVQVRMPILFDRHQFLLWIGVTCPRHRRIWKERLGWFGQFLNDREWQMVGGEEVLVSVRRKTA